MLTQHDFSVDPWTNTWLKDDPTRVNEDFAPLADADLFVVAVLAARARGWKAKVGNILSTDLFYADHDPDEWKMWALVWV